MFCYLNDTIKFRRFEGRPFAERLVKLINLLLTARRQRRYCLYLLRIECPMLCVLF